LSLDEDPIKATKVAYALRALLIQHAAVYREMARRLDLGPNDLTAIQHLAENPDLGPAELSRRLGITTASATALLDRMENLGHLRREPNQKDRRRLTITITPQAMNALLTVLKPVIEEIDLVAAEFSAEEQETIIKFLKKATDSWRKYS